MVFFAVLANTLLLTILISLLSNTFSTVAQNAAEEAMYQHACLTLNGISSDAILSYTPPLNLLAVVIILPASFILSPRWLHKLNIALLRVTSWPILLIVRLCSQGSRKQQYLISGPASYMESTAEKASHLISWIPLPRSRTNPDRDIIEAAFVQAKSKNLQPNDWEEWTASMLQIRDQDSTPTKGKSDRNITNKNDHEEPSRMSQTPIAAKYGSMERPQDQKPTQTSARFGQDELSTSSPLAKIFGGGGGGRHDHHHHHQTFPLHPSSPQQTRPTQDESNGKEKQREEGKDEEFQSEIEKLTDKSELHLLVGKLVERMEDHEKAQKRIEDLLQQILQKKSE